MSQGTDLAARLVMFQSLVDSLPWAIFWKDRESRYLGCNKACAAIAGLSHPREIAGRFDSDLRWRESAAEYRADDLAVIESGQPRLGERIALPRPDGETMWIERHRVPLRDASGAVIGVVGWFEDVTARKAAEDAEAQAQLEATLEMATPLLGVDGDTWQVPQDVRTVTGPVGTISPAGNVPAAAWLFFTPSALGDAELVPLYERVLVALDPQVPDAADHLRTAAAQVEPRAYVADLNQGSLVGALGTVRQLLAVGTVALLVVVGASLLVNVAEQLRERRKPLAVLVAFGTRRRTLGLSVLWQVAVPMAVGIVLAVVTGTGLGLALREGAGAPLGVDWWAVGLTSGGAALVVLLVTAASLPLLVGLTRSEALHAE